MFYLYFFIILILILKFPFVPELKDPLASARYEHGEKGMVVVLWWGGGGRGIRDNAKGVPMRRSKSP